MRFFTSAIAALLCTTTVQAQVATPTRPITDPHSLVSASVADAHPVPLADLAMSRTIRDAVFGADGRHVFLVTNLAGRFNIWRVDASGSWPVQLTQSDDVQEALAVSPDGRTLYYMQDSGGDELHDLYAVPTGGGVPRNLTASAKTDESYPTVSPDGRLIAMVSKRAEASQSNIALLDASSGAVRELTHEPEAGVRWSIIGWSANATSLLAMRENASTQTSSVWRLDTLSGKASRIAQPQDGQFGAAGASPDGRVIAASTDAGTGQLHAGLFDPARQTWQWLKPTPWEQSATDVSPDGRTMVVRTNADGRSSLSVVDMATGKERPLAMPPGRNSTIGARAFTADSRYLLVTHAGADAPTNLYVADLRDPAKPPRQITHLAMASVDAATLPRSQVVTYRSDDGTLVSAIVTMPANLRRDGRNPAVVLPHGGPTGQSQDGFVRTAVALASRGYITIAPNFRGSTGYGLAFQNANRMDLGGGDLRDVIGAKRFLVASGYVDPHRVGIAGESYGGFLTLMAIARTPGEFAAAVQSYGIVDWAAMWRTSDPFFQQYQKGLMGTPDENAGTYKASSPLTYLSQVKAPLLSLQGEKDPRVTRDQAQQVADRLKAQGAINETVFYPDEGHGFTKREHQIDALQRTMDWFDRYLKPAGTGSSVALH